MSISPNRLRARQAELGQILESSVDAQGRADSWTGASLENLSPTDGTFPAAIALCALQGPTEAGRRLSAFLLSQLSGHGTLNYWVRGSATAAGRPFPDDFDASACSLLGLRNAAGETEPEHLAGFLFSLTTAEAETGGPYRTWLIDASADECWKDIDVAVNANIAAFLAKEGSRLPGLDAFLSSAIGTASPYYIGLTAPMYFLARARVPGTDGRIRAWASLEPEDEEEPIERAWRLSAAVWSGATESEASRLAERLLEIPPDRWNRPSRICIDPLSKQGAMFAWSVAAGAACGMEALRLYEDSLRKEATPTATAAPAPTHARVAAALSTLGPDISAMAQDTLRRIVDTDGPGRLTGGIRAFATAARWDVDATVLDAAEDATVFGWAAYTILDDALDGDANAVHALPAATVLLRRVGQAYASVLPTEFQSVVHRLLDRVDTANAWEALHARGSAPPSFPDDPSWPGERSIAHALAFIAIFVAANGTAPDDPRIDHVTDAFLHALAARQIDDDLHDWREDLSKNRWTPINARLFGIGPMERPRAFWEDIAPRWAAISKAQTDAALSVAASIPGLAAIIGEFVAPIRASCDKAQRERERTLRFLAAYQKLSEGG